MASKHRPEDGLKELLQFIDSAKLDDGSLSLSDPKTKSMYKKFYALLVFDHILQEKLTIEDQKTYAREAISDLSHGFFLTCIGLYKPARTSARSGIENLARLFLLYRGVDATKITSVYELFDSLNEIVSGEQLKRVGSLRSLYKELCKTVHSTSAEYMNLEVPFNTMLRFDEDKFSLNREVVYNACKIAGDIMFIEFDSFIQVAHHSQRDLLSDGVSKTVRREARVGRETE
ncbi:hypothetical protein [Sulfitobacter pontiacus]|uniref:hypothetical protein n=1 Tax=Sulfitobacter pontiacus TaxID=60137 RepID=UPI0030EBAFC4|tara:strand:+ start:22062 stop:22754 length:693 start_codon:yes stop_codon:yes gene_type:complete